MSSAAIFSTFGAHGGERKHRQRAEISRFDDATSMLDSGSEYTFRPSKDKKKQGYSHLKDPENPTEALTSIQALEKELLDLSKSKKGATNIQKLASTSKAKGLLLHKFDNHVRIRVGVMLFFSIVEIIVMLIWNQTTGDGDAIKSTNLNDFGADKYSCEVIMSALIFIHLLLLLEYYLYQRRYEHKSWFLLDSLEWKNHRWFYFLLEVCVIATHPFPAVPVDAGRYLSVLMFPRLYIIFRLLKVNNSTYKERFIVMKNLAFRAVGTVGFNWLFSFRVLIITHSWLMTLGITMYAFLTLGYSLYIFERITPADQGTPWTLNMAYWNTIITATTVGYGDISAWSQQGRTIACIIAVSGVTIASLLIFVIINTLTLNPLEAHVDSCKESRFLNGRQKWAAARYIQLWWRRALRVRRNQPIGREFEWRNRDFKAKLQEIRREIALIPLGAITAVEELHADDGEDDGRAKIQRLRHIFAEHEELVRAVEYMAGTQRQLFKLLGSKKIPPPIVWSEVSLSDGKKMKTLSSADPKSPSLNSYYSDYYE